jgi:hypothetical protein
MKELSYYLYTEGKDYPLGCRLFAALKLDPGKHAFFDPQKEEPLRSKMLWRMLSNYARIHNIRPMRPPDGTDAWDTLFIGCNLFPFVSPDLIPGTSFY